MGGSPVPFALRSQPRDGIAILEVVRVSTLEAVWQLASDIDPFGGPAPVGQGLQAWDGSAWRNPAGAGRVASGQILAQYAFAVPVGTPVRSVSPVNGPTPQVTGGYAGTIA